MNVSKSQARRIASQTDTVDVPLLISELAMANGHIEWHRVELAKQIEMTNTLGAEVERLQAELEKERRLHGMARSTISSRTAEVERLQAEVKSLKPKRLTRNAAECHNCNTIIESKHRHDWVQCNCVPPDNGIYVDGGLAYSRRGAGINANYTDLCEYE